MEREEYNKVCHELRQVVTILGGCASKLERVLDRLKEDTDGCLGDGSKETKGGS